MEVRITKLRVGMAALFVLAGVGLGSLLSPLIGNALATVGTVSNISDHSAAAYFAKVSSDGKLAVGDGAGPLSVDGTLTVRPAAPASPWRAYVTILGSTGKFIAGPSAVPINVTHVSASLTSSDGFGIDLMGYRVPSSATTCDGATFDAALWGIDDQVNGRAPLTPLSFTFPTPLQYKPPANTKACLWAYTAGTDLTKLNAVGFYGG
jgi:hypothetical protein